jgi:hypothetical protein
VCWSYLLFKERSRLVTSAAEKSDGHETVVKGSEGVDDGRVEHQNQHQNQHLTLPKISIPDSTSRPSVFFRGVASLFVFSRRNYTGTARSSRHQSLQQLLLRRPIRIPSRSLLETALKGKSDRTGSSRLPLPIALLHRLARR